jgi:hypothetical protein
MISLSNRLISRYALDDDVRWWFEERDFDELPQDIKIVPYVCSLEPFLELIERQSSPVPVCINDYGKRASVIIDMLRLPQKRLEYVVLMAMNLRDRCESKEYYDEAENIQIAIQSRIALERERGNITDVGEFLKRCFHARDGDIA